jgi:adenine C2-methylase RlmN of 23S rRNA A2503 and tRNA A37
MGSDCGGGCSLTSHRPLYHQEAAVWLLLTPYLCFNYSHLIRHPESSWADIPDFPKAAVAILDSQFSKFTTTVLSCKQSTDGETTKLLLQLQDGMEVEAVIMSYDKRATLCVSSQVGCQMGCTFCATGQ